MSGNQNPTKESVSDPGRVSCIAAIPLIFNPKGTRTKRIKQENIRENM
jgi:hypothetical protein